MQNGEVALGDDIALFGSLMEPVVSFLHVLFHTLSMKQHESNEGLCIGIAAQSRSKEFVICGELVT